MLVSAGLFVALLNWSPVAFAAPRIVEAAMADRDSDGRADRVTLTYSQRIRHARDTDGRYPFTVSGYRVRQVNGASGTKSLVLLLKEKTSPDPNSKPSIEYDRTRSKPVLNLWGRQAVNQTYRDTFPVRAVFVAPGGNDVNTGTQAAPKQTISAAIAKAEDVGALDIYLAGGTYGEQVHPTGGMTISGGFTTSFTRSSASAATAILTGGKDVTTTQFGTVFVLDVGETVTLARLRIEGPNASDPGATSYGVVVRNSTVKILNSTIVAGDGANGAAGGDGVDASTGIAATEAMSGDPGGAAHEESFACETESHGAGGAAGVNAAAPAGASPPGGRGGDGGEMDTSCSWTGLCENCDATSGDPGLNAPTHSIPGNKGIGGPGGSGGDTCGPGIDGTFGFVANGAAGQGGVGSALVNFFWVASPGADGGTGQNGGGGGGGGGSGGCDLGIDSWGAGGGGGGAGGARAQSGGQGGDGGGASFGVFGYQADITVTGSTLIGGLGGQGGPGGDGGQGQNGGAGGAAGLAAGDSKAGGKGGNGAHGGHGGGGGGGAGGYSFLIYTYASTVTQTGNTLDSGTGASFSAGGISAPNAAPAVDDGNHGGSGWSGLGGAIRSCAHPSACN